MGKVVQAGHIFVLLCLAAFLLSACQSRGDQLAQQYENMKATGAGLHDLCVASAETLDAYRREGNKKSVDQWWLTNATVCAEEANRQWERGGSL